MASRAIGGPGHPASWRPSSGTPAPVLYAVDGLSMKTLWKTALADLEPGGKYVTPVAAHGVIYVATDRLHAFVPAL